MNASWHITVLIPYVTSCIEILCMVLGTCHDDNGSINLLLIKPVVAAEWFLKGEVGIIGNGIAELCLGLLDFMCPEY